MKSFKNYLRQQLHENQDSDSYAKYGIPDNVDVIVNRGKGYDENVKGNPATKYLSFIGSRDTDSLAKMALDDYKEYGPQARDGEVRTVTDPATGKSIQMTYGKDVAGRGMVHKIKVIPKTPAANTPATTPAPATATNTTRNLNLPDPEDWPPFPGGTKFWSHDGKVHTEHATEVDMKAFSVKNPSQWTGAQTPDGSMHWKTPGTGIPVLARTPHVTAPKVKGAGLVGVITAPLIAAGTALVDNKSLADAGRDAVEALVNNLDPFITTTLGDDSLVDSTPEEYQKDMDAAHAHYEKQAKDEEEKAKQKSFADTKSGNNSLNKTITDILSVSAKKNI